MVNDGYSKEHSANISYKEVASVHLTKLDLKQPELVDDTTCIAGFVKL